MIFRTLAASLLLSTAAFGEDRAIVVGIDDYSTVAGANSLNGAVADSDQMRGLLIDGLDFPERAIVHLTNAAATSDTILTALIDTAVRETNPGDRVVFYFAGLGTVLSDGSAALVAYDGAGLLGRIPLATIAEVLGVIEDRKITVVLDASFDGGPIGARGLPGALAQGELPFSPNVAVWSASQMGQFAWEQLDHGVFTQAFVEGASLADSDKNGTLTNGEMLAHIDARLEQWCEEATPCASSGRGFQAAFSGNEDDVLMTLSSAPAIEPPVDDNDLISLDEDAPPGLRETIGFVKDLFAPSNAAGLSLAIKGGRALQVGDSVTFTASAQRSGTLLLLDVDPLGRLAQVYPSQLVAEEGSRVSAGQPLIIPSALGANGRPLRIRITEPAGQGLLLGLFIEGDLPQLAALMPAGIAGGPVQNAGQSLFEISQNLLRLEADPDQPVAWSATFLPYRIEP